MINIVGPVGLLGGFIEVVRGRLSFNRTRLILFLGLLSLVTLGSMYRSMTTVPLGATGSVPSILQFLGLTFFTTFEFAVAMDERRFFFIVNRVLLFIAIAGILQFSIQFLGVQIFTFSDYLPSAIMAEKGWNLQISYGIGQLYKSNGFFLVEPSVTSQFSAVAIVIEVLFFNRLWYILIFSLAFVAAFSGTGGFVLFGFIVASSLRLGVRGLTNALILVMVLTVMSGLVMLVSPDVAAMAQGRMNELQTPDTSGYMRFVTPFMMIGDVLDDSPMVALVGLGGGTSEHLTLPYAYEVNTPVKIATEYGFPALVIYVALFLSARRTPRQEVLVLPLMLLLLFTGGYQQFAPIIFFVALITCVASLKPFVPTFQSIAAFTSASAE